ncbi:hypothetical protein [Streptomyces akebiae]|uniref:Uncharacterized protein n=1 Tax=Streptomyces akebiae TaxID=2865673 RepID=A0ABX8Y594_9ACTN|nr:hypothetical protein [Streptomyces akebiae]QYX82652.1 hypothetical protein K1J60_44355 [Streptomyces akebiae]
MRLKVERPPGDRDPKPVWLRCSATAATPVDVDCWWQSFLRRFDLKEYGQPGTNWSVLRSPRP